MIGKQGREQEAWTLMGPLRDFLPDDHILVRVDRVLDLSWLREWVQEVYCEDNGRPSIDPEAAVRLMLAGFFLGIVHDRKLMREAHVNLAIRWFAGYGLQDRLPDHSSLTRIRQRWGAERFRRVFERTVRACVEAGLVSGQTVHVDATLIRADVSWESLTREYVEEVWRENEGEGSPRQEEVSAPPEGGGRGKWKKRSRTDPEATLATSRKDQRLEPSYKQHTAVDDRAGVIVDVEMTTGEVNEGQRLLEAVERVEARTGRRIERVTADGAYAHGDNYRALEERGIEAVIPPGVQGRTGRGLPAQRFKYDAKHERVVCPAGKWLRRCGRAKNGWIYRVWARDCRGCARRERCLPRTARARSILIVDGYEALLRARRRRASWDEEMERDYRRHRWRVEGVHGEAKTQHGLRRAVRRGLWNVAIQVYLTAAVINLKRLAAPLGRYGTWMRLPLALGGALRDLFRSVTGLLEFSPKWPRWYGTPT